jgi:hypothetical protein
MRGRAAAFSALVANALALLIAAPWLDAQEDLPP